MVESGRRRPRDPRAGHRGQKPRSFFDGMNSVGAGRGLGRARLYEPQGRRVASGPIAKNHGEAKMTATLVDGARPRPRRWRVLRRRRGRARPPSSPASRGLKSAIAPRVDRDRHRFKFCWIVDFPMFEYDEDAKKIDFSHNPFLDAAGRARSPRDARTRSTSSPTSTTSSATASNCRAGAIRNHRPEIMYKAFAIAGYTQRAGRHATSPA